MAHNPIFQTECKITIDGISYQGEVINTGKQESYQGFNNYRTNENKEKLNEMNDLLKNLFHL